MNRRFLRARARALALNLVFVAAGAISARSYLLWAAANLAAALIREHHRSRRSPAMPEVEIKFADDPFVPEQFTASIGRIVAYQHTEGTFLPALIIECHGDPDNPHVAVNLRLFYPGTGADQYVTSRQHGPGVGQWLPRAPRSGS